MEFSLPLHRLLLDHDLGLLRIIADLWDVQLEAGEARAAAGELAGRMLKPAAVAEMLETLPPDAREALDALQAAGGSLPVAQLSRQCGEIRAMGPGRRDREQPWLAPASALESLWYRGLIGRGFGEAQLAPQEYFFVPSDLTPLLPPPAAPTRPAPGHSTPEPETQHLADSAIVDDVCTALAFHQICAHDIALARRLPLADFLLQPDCLDLIEHLQARLELLSDSPSRPNPAQARPWLEAPRGDQRRRLAEAWQIDAGWHDLAQVPGLLFGNPLSGADGPPNDPLAARQGILSWLAKAPAGEWWSLESFITAMQEMAPDFQRPAGDYDSWLIRDAATGDYLRGFEHWDRVEGALIRYVIRGPLYWLGIVDLGWEHIPGASVQRHNTTPGEEQTPEVFRITMAGRAFLRGEAWPADPEPERLRITPDGTLEIPRYANCYERFTAARFTDWLPVDFRSHDRVRKSDQIYHYRITGGSLARARAQGVAVRHVLGFLAKASINPVPRHIAQALNRWEREGPEAAITETAVLRVKSADLLERLRDSPKTKGLLGEALGPLAVEVRRTDLDKLHAAMLEMGLMADGGWQAAFEIQDNTRPRLREPHG